ncbi:hypothetical protein QN386_13490 [Pseudomonas sp. CCI3.2]|uniref:hypothetical protein n=1 Tax=unclassified Pseudomonas TaxID=196821 RepID=UPI002AC9A33A|nr:MULTISPECIES: hypothetical protein [unclassified Pseudomonas]MEB0076920.1 hypothetical protein [Pseudomonas sp. MH10out]MEB0102330.1 hypothetical protein [Pseudomonas sp. CCI3.2]MEB0129640.1 hypothetical protein [Pseudomonas sp. CCI2.4]MEB0156582.1 hypothetical protein [Pseudomonas sp. AH2 (2023)]MEB0165871.1 hypothetical protein [Pseudomonas sp. CCC4.4]
MKLVHRRTLQMDEKKYVHPPAEALVIVKRLLAGHREIEGLAELRRASMVYHDRYVWEQVERGEWVLTKPEARTFDWGDFEPHARHRRMLAALEDPPPQPKPLVLIFRAIDSETAEWITNRKYIGRLDGAEDSRKIDSEGVGYIPLPSKRAKVSMSLVGS